MHLKKKAFQLLVAVLVVLMSGGAALSHPRIVVGEPPTGWSPQGPAWFIAPTRAELISYPASSAEWRIVYDWIDGCVSQGRVRTDMVDGLDVLGVLRLEGYLGVPPEARGILASVWCMEASMLTTGTRGGPIRGDYSRGIARAHGPAQLWPWFRHWCGLGDRGGADDLFSSLTCYWSRVVDRYHARATSRCSEPWAVAEALAANGPRYLKRGCDAQSSHWRAMMRWR